MRLGMIAMAGLVCLGCPISAASGSEPSIEEQVAAAEVAALMLTNDWSALSRRLPAPIILQDPTAPLLDTTIEPSVDTMGALLSTCRLTFLAGDWTPGERQSLGEADRFDPPRTFQVIWLCPGFLLAAATVSDLDGRVTIRLGKSQASSQEISDLRKSRRNADIVEGFVSRALVEPEFKIEQAPRSEAPRKGEPSDQDLNEAALAYLSAILGKGEAKGLSGLEYLNFGSMSWADRESREFKHISFREVRDRLDPCRLSVGWPRRYDRNGERVLAFSSGWRCLGPSGPYNNTLFLEIRNGKVAGGRFIENEGPPAVAHVPTLPGDKRSTSSQLED